MNQIILDVRERDEFSAEHIPDSASIPLSQFGQLAPGILQTWAGKEILIMCRSGARAKLAEKHIEQLGLKEQLRAQVFTGGILEWKKQGKPTTTQQKNGNLPVMCQVQLITGFGILASVLLSFFVNQNFIWIAAFFGAGLTLAGLTGFCGLASALSLMPWNKR